MNRPGHALHGFMLALVTPPDDHQAEPALLESFRNVGLEHLHIRKPGFSRDELRAYLSGLSPELLSISRIHSHYELAQEFGAGGVHLTEFARSSGLRASDFPGVPVSASFHDPRSLAAEGLGYDRVFLGPVFRSISKPSLEPGLNHGELREFLRKFHLPVIALGGIAPSNVGACREIGFSGAAALGWVWHARDPLRAFGELTMAVATLNPKHA